jgi:micrococcal nuclease
VNLLPSPGDGPSAPRRRRTGLRSRSMSTSSRRRGTAGQTSVGGAVLVLVLLAVFTACDGSETALPSPSTSDVVQPLPPGTDGTVDRVVDGDTVVVDGRDVRLIGIDTPETVKRGAPVACYGPEASRATKALLPPGERVRLVADVERQDRYGRELRYVYRLDDGLFVQSYLVREGFARTLVVKPNIARRDVLASIAAEAKADGRGLWGAC